MINRKKVFLILVLLVGTSLFILEAAAQRKQRPGQSFSPAGMTATRLQSASPRKLDDKSKDVNQSFAEALSVIRKNYVDGKKLSYDEVVKSSIVGMLRTLDPHSTYYIPKDFAAQKHQNSFGIGVTLGDRKLRGETATFLLAPSDSVPAANASLRFGDRIIDVNGWEAKGHSSTEVDQRLAGTEGSKVKVTIERAANGQRQTVEITRSSVKPYVPDAYMLQPGIGYIDLTRGFGVNSTEELSERLDNLRKHGMTALVLDLRNNPGGLLHNAVGVAEQFLSRGQMILRTVGRSRAAELQHDSQNENPEKSPLVLLVNRKTASGSELIAAALQEHHRALIVGETTFGQGIIQSVIPLNYGAALTLAISKIHTPSGRLIQRDYSNLGYYEYLERGNGPDSISYRGAGVLPDEVVRPLVPSKLEERLIDPVFGFVRELLNARIVGFESYKVQSGIDLSDGFKPDELVVTDDLFKAFKQFVARTPGYGLTGKQLDANREFIVRRVRLDLATAAYGPLMAARLSRVEDPQVLKAIEVIPQAAALAGSRKN